MPAIATIDNRFESYNVGMAEVIGGPGSVGEGGEMSSVLPLLSMAGERYSLSAE